MTKLCFNSTTLRYIDLFKALLLIKQSGYDGVELMLNDTHLHPLKQSVKEVAEIRSFCSDNDIDIVCVAAGGANVLGYEDYEPSLIHPKKFQRSLRLEFIKRSMELACYLDSPVLNINSGRPRGDISSEEAYEHLFYGFEELLKGAGDLTLVLEPEPNFFVGTTEVAIDFIKKVGSPRLRLNLDIGHVFCSEENCYENIEKALPYSRHIHIEDIKNGVHHHEIPGEGDIDFERVMSSIKRSPYEHYISVELHHHDNDWERALQESRDFLLRHMG